MLQCTSLAGQNLDVENCFNIDGGGDVFFIRLFAVYTQKSPKEGCNLDDVVESV